MSIQNGEDSRPRDVKEEERKEERERKKKRKERKKERKRETERLGSLARLILVIESDARKETGGKEEMENPVEEMEKLVYR